MKSVGMQLTTKGDLAIDTSDPLNPTIQIGHTLYQNQYVILTAQKGEFKEYPTLGVGIGDMTNDEEIDEWKRRIIEDFRKDDLRVKKISIANNESFIDADYV